MRAAAFALVSLAACVPPGYYGGGAAGNTWGTPTGGGGEAAPPPPPPEELAVTGAATQLTRVTTDDQAVEDQPAPSPDGTWLLYVSSIAEVVDGQYTGNWSGRRVMKARADGGGGAVMLTAAWGQAYAPSWLPSGASYVAISDAMGGNDVLRALKVAPGAASSRVLAEREVTAVRGTTVSPDGTRVAFFSTVGGQDTLGTVRTNGAELTNLVPGRWPSWSPDGRQLAFVRDSGGRSAVYLTDAESGSDLTQLTDGDDAVDQPTWSPDGRYLAFVSNRGWSRFASGTADGSWNLFAIRADGSGLVQLTEGNHPLFTPRWGADGWIYFSSGGDLWRISPDPTALAAQ